MATQTPVDVGQPRRAAWDFGDGKNVAAVRVEEAVHVRTCLDWRAIPRPIKSGDGVVVPRHSFMATWNCSSLPSGIS